MAAKASRRIVIAVLTGNALVGAVDGMLVWVFLAAAAAF
jgi:hypothetical protein